MTSGKFWKKGLITLSLVIAMLFLVSGVALPDGGDCELALGLCWFDNMSFPDIALFYCGTGYVFCKKYLED